MTIHFSGIDERFDLAQPVTEPRLQRPEASLYRRYVKRALESGLILLTAPVTLPLVFLLALLVASDGGNPFFRQRRVGRNGAVFNLLKLRTMVLDAEDRLHAYLAQNPEALAEWDATQKLKTDPRITRFGRLLRKTSMDELPQLWNVLKGDMSLVGPRPMLVSQQPLYPGTAYFHLRPGITGLWQISDRNHCEFAERAKFDLAYYERVSFGTDVSIIAKTVRVVLRATGY